MTHTTYVPGTGTALVTSAAVLLVPDGLSPDRISRLWPLLSSGADLDAVLEALTEQGIRNTAPFVLLHSDRLLVRGDGCATLTTSGRTLGADGAKTWAEHAVPAGEAVRLATSADVGEEPGLPLVGGVVLVSAVLRGDVARAAAVLTADADASAADDEMPSSPAAEATPPARATVPAAARAVPVRAALPPEPLIPGPISSQPVWDAVGTEPWTPSALPGASELVDGVPGADDDREDIDSSTIMRGRAARAESATASTQDDTDHDGSTVLRSGKRGAPPVAVREDSGPQVLGIRCPDGHANPPHAQVCRRCGTEVADLDPELLPRPALGRLSFNDGNEVTLDRTVLIGRAPSANRFPKDDPPLLVRVSSPQQDISRTHVELRVEDWDVLLVDHSSNGTRLVRPGMEPQMLHKGEPVPVRPGSLIDLGDGVTVTLEDVR